LNTDNPFVLATIGVWLALEIAFVVRNRIRGRGGTAQDRGTRRLIALVTAAPFVLTGVVARALRHHSALWLPGGNTDAWLVVGLVVTWAGLALRVWSIAALGAEFARPSRSRPASRSSNAVPITCCATLRTAEYCC
jgi:hypothetical protein